MSDGLRVVTLTHTHTHPHTHPQIDTTVNNTIVATLLLTGGDQGLWTRLLVLMNKKLICRREAARRFMLLTHSRSLEITPLSSSY